MPANSHLPPRLSSIPLPRLKDLLSCEYRLTFIFCVLLIGSLCCLYRHNFVYIDIIFVYTITVPCTISLRTENVGGARVALMTHGRESQRTCAKASVRVRTRTRRRRYGVALAYIYTPVPKRKYFAELSSCELTSIRKDT